MAKQKQEDPPKGSPAWMATFSDLMNLLLCFFVLLFSMSSVNEEKFQMVIASLQSHFSVLQGGASTIGDGDMVSAGINQLQYYDTFYNPDANSNGDGQFDEDGIMNNEDDSIQDNGTPTDTPGIDQTDQGEQGLLEAVELSPEELKEQLEEKGASESEKIANEVSEKLQQYGIQDQVEVEFNATYVLLTLNGSILFDSGADVLREDAYPLIDKLGLILNYYDSNIIEVEGHTDNVPIHNSVYADNNVLSMYRALHVADYLRDITTLEAGRIKSSGRGDYVPIADNTTPEGRALNRRVVIKIYNSYNSDI